MKNILSRDQLFEDKVEPPTVAELYVLFTKVNKDATKERGKKDGFVPFSNTEYYAQQIQNIYDLTDAQSKRLARELVAYKPTNEALLEGMMSEIDILAQESKTRAEFLQKARAFLKEHAHNKKIAEDDGALEELADQYFDKDGKKKYDSADDPCPVCHKEKSEDGECDCPESWNK